MRVPRNVLVSLVAGLMPLAFAVAQDSSASATSPDRSTSMGNGSMMGGQMMTLNNQVNAIFSQLEHNVTDLKAEKDENTVQSKLVQQEALIEQLKSSLDGQCGMNMEMMGNGRGHMMGDSMMGSGMGMGNGMAGSRSQSSANGNSSPRNQ